MLPLRKLTNIADAVRAAKVATSKLQLRFTDRIAAAELLSNTLHHTLNKTLSSHDSTDIFVLGIARGGAVVADIVARRLGAAYFDTVNVRKLESPTNEEITIGAIVFDGTTFLNEPIIDSLNIPKSYIESEKANQEDELKTIEQICYTRPQRSYHMIKDRLVVLVDDGAATGATMTATISWLKQKQKPRYVIVALPVAPNDLVSKFKAEADLVETIFTLPRSKFHSIRQSYRQFSPVSNVQVTEIFQQRNST